MMTPYFSDSEAVDRLHATLQTALGKPFRERSYECVDLAREALEGAGLDMHHLGEIPRVSLTRGLWHHDSPLLDFLTQNPLCRAHLRPVDSDDPWLPGDLVVMKEQNNRSCLHLAVRDMHPHLYHLPRYGVVSILAERIARAEGLIHSVWRIRQ